MALETLKGKDLGKFVHVNHDRNEITFRIQNGTIIESGENGCQLDELIVVAARMIKGLNKKFPCSHNLIAYAKCMEALGSLQARKEDRERRGVEGRSLV